MKTTNNTTTLKPQSRLNDGLGDNFDPMSHDELHDKGPWVASEKGRTIASDDFTHDVYLLVVGDFFSDEQRKAYADNLAKKLNAPNVKVRG